MSGQVIGVFAHCFQNVFIYVQLLCCDAFRHVVFELFRAVRKTTLRAFAGRCKRQKADALIEGAHIAQHEAAAFQLIDDTYKAGFFDGHFLREAGLRNFAAAFDMVKSKPLVSRNAKLQKLFFQPV